MRSDDEQSSARREQRPPRVPDRGAPGAGDLLVPLELYRVRIIEDSEPPDRREGEVGARKGGQRGGGAAAAAHRDRALLAPVRARAGPVGAWAQLGVEDSASLFVTGAFQERNLTIAVVVPRGRAGLGAERAAVAGAGEGDGRVAGARRGERESEEEGERGHRGRIGLGAQPYPKRSLASVTSRAAAGCGRCERCERCAMGALRRRGTLDCKASDRPPPPRQALSVTRLRR